MKTYYFRISNIEFQIYRCMIIDIIFVILLVIALWKGYSRGFIIAIFSFLAIFIGLAAAVKFSVVVSAWLHNNTNIGTRWLPFISFLAVIIVVIILVRWIAGLIQTSVEFAMLGWLNRLGGIVLYVALYAMVYSIILFYATQMGIIKTEAIRTSVVYNIIEPWGPKSIEMLSNLIPVFKDMFQYLKNFFGSLAPKGV
jgi:membrane protein required for colicin V production